MSFFSKKTLKNILIGALPLLSSNLQAQLSPMPQEFMVWHGDRVAVVEAGKPLRIRVEDKNPNQTIVYDLPERSYQGYYWDGVLWATRRLLPSKSGLDVEILKSEDGRSWSRVAVHHGSDGGTLAKAYPLEEKDRFLLVSGLSRPFLLNGTPFLVALGRVSEKGVLEVQEGIDLGTEEPLYLRSQNQWSFNPNLYPILDILFHNGVLRTQDGFMLVSFHYGWIWVLDPKGKKKRFAQVFSSVANAKGVSPKRYEYVILSCQPNALGNLILATRTEDAVRVAPEIFPTGYTLQDLSDPQRSKNHEERLLESLKAFPLVQWWEFDPETGEKWEIPPPVGLPTHVKDLRVFMKFRFRFDPHGNLKAFY